MINYIYQVGPVDTWEGWTPMITNLSPDSPLYGGEARISAKLFLQVLEMAHDLASAPNNYWEGDIRGWDIYYSGLPPIEANDPNCNQWMIAWKQDNNGSTFIGSPFPLENYKDDLIFERN